MNKGAGTDLYQPRNSKGARMKFENVINLNSLIQRNGDLVSCDLDGETVLMSMETGKYYGMNSMGSHIWALLETTRSVSEICKVLLAEFDVERQLCEREMLAFLNNLARENLIKGIDESAA
jgi:hypothetical protein